MRRQNLTLTVCQMSSVSLQSNQCKNWTLLIGNATIIWMGLNKKQRSLVADKLMDSANVALAGLVVGQLIADNAQPMLIVLGFALYLWCWSVSIRMNKGVKRYAKS